MKRKKNPNQILNSTDVISAVITKIRNAINNNEESVVVPNVKSVLEILNILKNYSYIGEYEVMHDTESIQGLIKVSLKVNSKYRINEIKRISKPGLRVYVNMGNMPIVKNHYGIAVLSTSKGYMTNKQAKEEKVGGEYICSVS